MFKLALKIIATIIIILVIIYFGGFLFINSHKSEGISVLAYHHFMSSKEKEKYAKDNNYVISIEDFTKQMKYLKEHGYQSIDPQKIVCYVKNECKVADKSVLITIDDGNISSYYQALPILEKYGFNSINFVISSRLKDNTNKWNPAQLDFVGNDIIEDILTNHPSMYIGSHTDKLHDLIDGHNPIDNKTVADITQDLITSKAKLHDTKYLAYPFGTNDKRYQTAAKDANFTLAFTFKDNRNIVVGDNLYALPRIEIRGDYTMNDFKSVLKNKVTLKKYTKNLIKKILHKS